METRQEIAINAGNAAWKVWEALPEPKLGYMEWYYDKRDQSLFETLEGCVLGKIDVNDREDLTEHE